MDYAPESSLDTDDEYDVMEDVRTRADSAIARNLQAELDAEAAGIAAGAARPPPGPSITIGRSARPSGASHRPARTPTDAPPTRSKRQRADRVPSFADPVSEDFVVSGFRYPPRGGIRPRYPVTTLVVDTPFLTSLIHHLSSLVRIVRYLHTFVYLLCFVLFMIFCTNILLSDSVQDLVRASAEVGGPISASSWMLLVGIIKSFWQSWALALSSACHTCTCTIHW